MTSTPFPTSFAPYPRIRPEFPLVWDNTMRSSLIECPRKFAMQYLEHWKSRYPNIHLHAGSAWAHGLETTRRAFYCAGASAETAIAAGLAAMLKHYGDFDCPPDSSKSAPRLAEAFVFYFDRYPLETDAAKPFVGPSGPMIEFSFACPLGDDLLHPVTHEPLIFAGRADMIATYCGAVTIFDDKTTTSLGSSWAAQWDMRAQFTGYAWAAQQFGIPASQVLVRGISILKTKFDSAQAISHRSEWRIDRWLFQIKRDIRRAMQLWSEGYWDLAESDACGSYGGCHFRQVCSSPDPQPWLETGFVQKKWDPVHRVELALETSK